MVQDPVITEKHLPAALFLKKTETEKTGVTPALDAVTFREAKEEFEKEYLLQKLEENDWNISRTAEVIEIERSNLHRKIKSFGIELKK